VVNVTDRYQKNNGAMKPTLGPERSLATDSLDSRIEAALKEYGAAEPRFGLEERILANLRTESARSVGWNWRNWTAIAALAIAMVLVVIVLTWNLGKPTAATVAHHLSTALPKVAGTQVPSNSKSSNEIPTSPVRKKRFGSAAHRGETEHAAAPKLDVFPSPLPLSEQEKMLASYVAKYPKEAALVAEARTEALQREVEEETRADKMDSVR